MPMPQEFIDNARVKRINVAKQEIIPYRIQSSHDLALIGIHLRKQLNEALDLLASIVTEHPRCALGDLAQVRARLIPDRLRSRGGLRSREVAMSMGERFDTDRFVVQGSCVQRTRCLSPVLGLQPQACLRIAKVE